MPEQPGMLQWVCCLLTMHVNESPTLARECGLHSPDRVDVRAMCLSAVALVVTSTQPGGADSPNS